jgi:hypothetical protein
VPSLRHFFRRSCSNSGSSSGPSNRRGTPDPSKIFFTIGSLPRNRISAGVNGFSLETVRHEQEDWEQLPVHGREDWERLHDGASDRSDVPIDPRGLRKGKGYGNCVEVNDVELHGEERAR